MQPCYHYINYKLKIEVNNALALIVMNLLWFCHLIAAFTNGNVSKFACMHNTIQSVHEDIAIVNSKSSR